jgi:hypothetical protein
MDRSDASLGVACQSARLVTIGSGVRANDRAALGFGRNDFGSAGSSAMPAAPDGDCPRLA